VRSGRPNNFVRPFGGTVTSRYLLRDRDQIFGKEFVDQVKAMGIKQVLSAPRSPWQRAYIERLIGSIRRECLNHVIVFGEGSLHRTLTAYFAYCHEWRTHLSLAKDAPPFRRMQPSAEGKVIEIREVGGLHHHYERRAA
jgi:putative transposase